MESMAVMESFRGLWDIFFESSAGDDLMHRGNRYEVRNSWACYGEIGKVFGFS